MTDKSPLFDPVAVGSLILPNRILMAPLTRNRAQGDGVPSDLAQVYYGQRASAGLIVSEATQIDALGKGYLDTPGIYTDAQVAGWRGITDAVHAGGGRIFCQLWHVGRISHVSLLPEGRSPVAPSAIRADAQTFTAQGFEDVSAPVALDAEGIAAVIGQFRHAAACARSAGFDGVEVHAANGYLLDQVLQDGSNHREDRYGGPVENRMRLLIEVLDAVATIWPRDRMGVRVSPLGQAGDIHDSDPEALFGAVYAMIADQRLAYLHVMEAFPGSGEDGEGAAMIRRLRDCFTGAMIVNGGYDADRAAQAVEDGMAAVTFGRPFIANPDLPERVRIDGPMNDPDPSTFYGGGAEGYTDYPALSVS